MRLGGGAITFSFTGGSMDSSAIRPATLITSNAYEQKIIESHPDFKNGKIKLIKEEKTEVPAESVEFIAIESVHNMQTARQYLMEQGVELKDLAKKTDVMARAKELKVTFPNWTE